MDFNTLLYKIVLLSTFIYIMTMYKDSITNTYNKLLNLIDVKFDYMKTKNDLQSLIVLKEIHDEYLSSISDEFVIYKIDPFLKIPESSIMVNSGELKKIREEYVKFVIDKILTNKIIKKYIYTVHESLDEYVIYLMMYFDTNIYMKIILPYVENKTTVIKRK